MDVSLGGHHPTHRSREATCLEFGKIPVEAERSRAKEGIFSGHVIYHRRAGEKARDTCMESSVADVVDPTGAPSFHLQGCPWDALVFSNCHSPGLADSRLLLAQSGGTILACLMLVYRVVVACPRTNWSLSCTTDTSSIHPSPSRHGLLDGIIHPLIQRTLAECMPSAGTVDQTQPLPPGAHRPLWVIDEE